MTQAGSGDEFGGLRRLPKKGMGLQRPLNQPARSVPAPSPPADLYFEPLPEPAEFRETATGRYDDALQWQYVPLPEDEALPFTATEIDPATFFRRPAEYQAESSAPEAVQELDPPVFRPSPTTTRASAPVFDAASSTPLPLSRKSSTDVVTTTSTVKDDVIVTKSSGQIAAAVPPAVTDPKPAYARTSGIARSRPSRPSGAFAVARPSGEVPAARISGTIPAVKASGSYQTAADQANGRTSGGVLLRALAEAPVEETETRDRESRQNDVLSSAKPQTASRKKLPTVFGLVVASVLLVIYAFEFGPLESATDAVAGHLTSGGAGSGAAQSLAGLLPWLLALPALVLFGLILWLLAGVIGLRQTGGRRTRRVKTTSVKSPLQQFKAAAQRHGISNRTAYRGWRLLETACGPDRTIELGSTLTNDLQLSSKDLRAIHLQLLVEMQRKNDAAMRLPAVETVADLLLAVDDAPAARLVSTSGEVTVPGDPGQVRRSNTKS